MMVQKSTISSFTKKQDNSSKQKLVKIDSTAHKRHKDILKILQWCEKSKDCADRVIADMDCLNSCGNLVCPKAVDLASRGPVDLKSHRIRIRVSKSIGFDHLLEASCSCTPDDWFREVHTSRPVCSNA